MATTAKTASSARNTNGKAQVFRGSGVVDPGYNPGAGLLTCIAIAEYDFNVDGALASGAIWGTGVVIPTNSLIISTWARTIVAPAGPSNLQVTCADAQIGNASPADANLMASTAVSGMTVNVNTIGKVLRATATTFVSTSNVVSGAMVNTPGEILFDFSPTTPAATTAGHILFYVEYVTTSGVL